MDGSASTERPDWEQGRDLHPEGCGVYEPRQDCGHRAALAATAYARALGQKVIAAGDIPVEGGTTPAAETPPDVPNTQRKLNALQWAIPTSTGFLVLLDALMGEQQRPKQVTSGVIGRIVPS
jgi:hypothetical protein